MRSVTVGEADPEACALLGEVADAVPIAAWCVVGEVMATIHAAERGVALPPRRPAESLEVVVDTRLLPQGSAMVEHALAGRGLRGVRSKGHRHRYEKDGARLDVVMLTAPAHRHGRRDDEPLASYEQAILRAGPVNLRFGTGELTVRRPALLGALLLEAHLASSSEDEGDSVAARRGLAFLLTLVVEPMALRAQMRPDESRQLRRQSELLDPEHPAWLAMAGADAGRRSLRLLAS
jgi:hypothetical protein